MKQTRKLAKKYYQDFSDIDGNQHIAGMFAIEKILDIFKSEKPKAILELGLGIGSISYSVINLSDLMNIELKYYGTEDNKFCLDSLPKNLGENFKKIKVFENIDKLPQNQKFDFVIVDGTDSSLKAIKDLVSSRAIIFIEGWRGNQVNTLKELFPNFKHTDVVSTYRNPDFGPFPVENWSCGGQIIFTNPNFSQLLKYFRTRIKTSFTYKVIRKLK